MKLGHIRSMWRTARISPLRTRWWVKPADNVCHTINLVVIAGSVFHLDWKLAVKSSRNASNKHWKSLTTCTVSLMTLSSTVLMKLIFMRNYINSSSVVMNMDSDWTSRSVSLMFMRYHVLDTSSQLMSWNLIRLRSRRCWKWAILWTKKRWRGYDGQFHTWQGFCRNWPMSSDPLLF